QATGRIDVRTVVSGPYSRVGEVRMVQNVESIQAHPATNFFRNPERLLNRSIHVGVVRSAGVIARHWTVRITIGDVVAVCSAMSAGANRIASRALLLILDPENHRHRVCGVGAMV